MSSRTINPPMVKPRRESLLQGAEKAQLQRRQRVGRIFKTVTLIPVILALTLIVTLITDVYLDTWTWQVVESNGSGQTFARSSANGWHGVVEQELRAQGETEADIAAFFADPEEVRKFKARNRVELVYVPRIMSDVTDNQTGWRWVVSNNRDKLEESYGLLEGRRTLADIKANLTEDQRLYLNPWLDFSFFVRNNSGNSFLAGLITALLGSLWVVFLVVLISVPIRCCDLPRGVRP
jgi:phosphate transport system permease protein